MKKALLATLAIMLGWIIIPAAIGGSAGFFLGLYGALIALPLAAAIGYFSGRISSKALIGS